MRVIMTSSLVLSLVLSAGSAFAQAQAVPKPAPRKLAFVMFPGVQLIDYAGPAEVFGQTGTYDGDDAFEIYTVAEKAGPMPTNINQSVNVKYDFETAPLPDILIVPGGGTINPGGRGVGGQLDNQRLLKWIRDSAAHAEIVMSVCNGAHLLAKAGLLDGLAATTTSGIILDKLREAAPTAKIVDDQRFVDNGKIITTAGVTAGIDGALHIVERLFSRGWAQTVALNMEYNWQPERNWARAALADKYLRFVYDVPNMTPLASTGSTEFWEKRYSIRDGRSPADLASAINQAIQNGKTWGPKYATGWQRVDKASPAPKSQWRFTDEKGRPWVSEVAVLPEAGDRRIMTITARLVTPSRQKAGAKKAGAVEN